MLVDPLSLSNISSLSNSNSIAIQYLVLQLHYLNVDLLPVEGDTAGVDLHYTEEEPEKCAGTVSVHVTTNLPALSRTYQDGACSIAEGPTCCHLSILHFNFK